MLLIAGVPELNLVVLLICILATLGDEIGIDIELRSTEAKTGSFSTDILAVEANTDNKLLLIIPLNIEYIPNKNNPIFQ